MNLNKPLILAKEYLDWQKENEDLSAYYEANHVMLLSQVNSYGFPSCIGYSFALIKSQRWVDMAKTVLWNRDLVLAFCLVEDAKATVLDKEDSLSFENMRNLRKFVPTAIKLPDYVEWESAVLELIVSTELPVSIHMKDF